MLTIRHSPGAGDAAPTRRALLLGLGVAATTLMVGCSGAPQSQGPVGESGSPLTLPPTAAGHPSAGHSASASQPSTTVTWKGLADELRASAALFVAASATKDATPAQRAWAASASTMCLAQAACLSMADPMAPDKQPSPETRPSAPAHAPATFAAAALQVAARQKVETQRLLAVAQQAASGDQVLLLAALATAAHATAAFAAPVTTSTLHPTHVQVGTRPDALQTLLSLTNAAAQGYEMGAGRLAPTDRAGLNAARDRINALWTLRDSLQQQVVASGATPSPASLVYAQPGSFSNPAARKQTWGRLELGLLNGWARVAAASSGRDRAAALQQMMAQADAAQAWGVSVGTWPGWTHD